MKGHYVPLSKSVHQGAPARKLQEIQQAEEICLSHFGYALVDTQSVFCASNYLHYVKIRMK